MGWEEDLFGVLDELEQEAEAAFHREREPDLLDRSRAEYAQVTLAARMMASVEGRVELGVTGVGVVSGALERVAAEWCLVSAPGQDWIVRLAAVGAVVGASPRAVPPVAWSPLTRLGLGSALRRLGEAGERCVVHRTDGTRHDGRVLRVGGDFAEVEEGAGSSARVVLVALGALAAVQSR